MTFRLARALILGLSLTGCRGCGEPARDTAEKTGPTMPTGLLSPLLSTEPPSSASPTARLTLPPKGGAGPSVELQIAAANDTPDRSRFERGRADSRFLSLDAMTLLHDAFARSSPGFDLFVPRLLDGSALARLRSELTGLRDQVAATETAGAAKARWGGVSPLISSLPSDEDWRAARAAFLGTIDAIIDFTAKLTEQGQGLWVLGT